MYGELHPALQRGGGTQQSAQGMGTTVPFLALLQMSRVTLGKRPQISDGLVLQEQTLCLQLSDLAGRNAPQLLPLSWS